MKNKCGRMSFLSIGIKPSWIAIVVLSASLFCLGLTGCDDETESDENSAGQISWTENGVAKNLDGLQATAWKKDPDAPVGGLALMAGTINMSMAGFLPGTYEGGTDVVADYPRINITSGDQLLRCYPNIPQDNISCTLTVSAITKGGLVKGTFSGTFAVADNASLQFTGATVQIENGVFQTSEWVGEY